MIKHDFNRDWKFFKRSNDDGFSVTLPHDAMILEKRSSDNPSGSAGAFFPGGKYIYERLFYVPLEWRGKSALFVFEGVYQNAKVFLNGTYAGGRPNGYMPIVVTAEEHLEYGVENSIRVEVDNSLQPNSRWYTGSGIYRPVWLYLGEKHHIRFEGVKISTISYNPAIIKVETEYTGDGQISIDILYDGEIVARGTGSEAEIEIPDAKLWSDFSPELYICRVHLEVEGKITDEVEETFGIRLVEWNSKGLFVNGKETLLRGGCVHHDNGILGARSYPESEDRRVRIHKEAGFNAIRSSHNPASRYLLEACDRHGIYVIDETWDVWYSHKSKYDYASDFEKNYLDDIRAMVNRDFNHPCVLMYSIGNEVSEPGEKRGLELTGEMVELVKKLDSTRAVTAGFNLFLIQKASKGKAIYQDGGGRDEKQDNKIEATGSLLFNIITSFVGTGMNKAANSKAADRVTSPALDLLDIAGYNYASGRYRKEGSLHPDRVIVGSETFPQDIAKNWKMVKELPYLIGDFMWTSWDYLGEAGMGAWSYAEDGGGFEKPYPWILAEGGAIDITGHIGAEAAYAAAVWGLLDKPYIGVRPLNHPGIRARKSVWRGTNAVDSWSWKGCEGNKAVVEVYADADRVSLYLNDRFIASKKVHDCKAVFKTRYTAGKIMAVAYASGGDELSRAYLESADEEIRISAKPEKDTVCIDEVLYIDVNLTDQKGVIESNDDRTITVEVAGGELLAFGSANPRTVEQYHTGTFTTYLGRSQAVVRADNKDGLIVTFSSPELQSVAEKINVV